MPQLDALRAFAVLSVIAAHTFPPLPVHIGIPGVWLFFVLSGFLITGILLRSRANIEQHNTSLGAALKTFYIRRSLRIFPLYYFALALLLWIGVPEARNNILWLATYLTNMLIVTEGRWVGCVSHFWTLAVEEQFYLIWPVVMLLLPRRLLAPGCLLAIAIGPVTRALMWHWTHNITSTLISAPACLDGLGAGSLLAASWHFGYRPALLRWRTPAVAAALVLTIAHVASQAVEFHSGLDYVVGGFAYASLFFWVVDAAANGVQGVTKRILEWKPLLYIGRISYGLYVFHLLVPEILPYEAPPSGIARFLYVTATTLALASLSRYLLERPFNHLKERLSSSAEARRVEALSTVS
jgi:peptidoglycan/LPS O-acetylase OafA/YrhL